MIRFHCSGCQKILKAMDDQAGNTGRCPKCNARFIIPGTPIEITVEPEPEPELELQPEQTAAIDDDEDEIRIKRPRDDDDEEDYRPKRKKRRKKKKKSSSIGGIDPFLPALGGTLVLGFLFIALGLAVPAAAYLAIVIGFIAAFAGGIWFLVVAFQHEVIHGVLCLLCGCYPLIYFFINIEGTWKPMALQVAGIAIYFIAALVAFPGMK